MPTDLTHYRILLNDEPESGLNLLQKGLERELMALGVQGVRAQPTDLHRKLGRAFGKFGFITPLIQRLRADGKEVFGFGEQKTPGPFIAACTRFIYLEESKPAKTAASKADPGQSKPATDLQTGQNLKANAKLITTLRNAVSASADDEGWANLSNIANRINNESPIDHRTYGFKKLADLFEAIDLFDVKREKTGTHNVISVRIAKVGGKKVKPKAVAKDWVDDDNIPF